jgi:hypothetical protein
MAYDDQRFGFLRVSVTPSAVRGEFFAVERDSVTRADAFHLDLAGHTMKKLT